ncbi:MAG: glycosyltransferase [Planctomycetaceae bacterium]|nr:glycosyltransferase [Planctomycetaceae bacterium]
MTSLSVAVVVPVYNRATSVLPTLESIAAQTAPPQRLVVVDDGSRDDSAAAVKRWIDQRRLAFDARVLCKPNGGVSSARNRGIRECGDCQWFAFLDSDDCWPDDFLERAGRALAEQPTAVAASADRMFVEETTGAVRRFDLAELSACPALWMLRWGAAISSCSVIRADLVREFGGFPEHLVTGEDASIYLPISLRGAWLHLPGQPARFVRRAPQPGGEEASLSRKFTDNHRRWARIYEEFFTRLGHDDLKRFSSRRRIRRLLSDRWAKAGQELERHGQLLAAAACYARAIRWRPGKWDRWKALIRMPVGAVLPSARRAA